MENIDFDKRDYFASNLSPIWALNSGLLEDTDIEIETFLAEIAQRTDNYPGGIPVSERKTG